MLRQHVRVSRHGQFGPGILVNRLIVGRIRLDSDFNFAILIDRKAFKDVVLYLAASRSVGPVPIAELIT
jgi:hypothetical protein